MSPLPEDPRPAPPRRYRCVAILEAPLLRLAGLTCRDFARLKADSLDRPLRFSERARLGLHGGLCSLCRRFAEQFALIQSLSRELEPETPPATEVDLVDPGARIAATVRARVRALDQ